VLEYQTVSGGAWTDASALFTHNGYNGTIDACCSNPLAGRSAFVDDGQGLGSSRLSLGSGGGNIRFRFRKGTDTSAYDRGWFIDDVRIYTCENVVSDSKLVVSAYLPTGQYPFHSAFSDHLSGWAAVNGSWGASNSYLVTRGLAGTSASVRHNQSYTYALMNYTVRMLRSGCEGCANRIIIRGNPTLDANNWWEDSYVFQYSNNGQYSIYKNENGVATALQGWTASPAIIPSDEFGDYWNVLRVSTFGSSMSFYINGTLVQTVSDATFSSGRVGVGFYDGTNENQLSVDWATLAPWFFIILPPLDDISPEQQALNQAAVPGGSPDMAP